MPGIGLDYGKNGTQAPLPSGSIAIEISRIVFIIVVIWCGLASLSNVTFIFDAKKRVEYVLQPYKGLTDLINAIMSFQTSIAAILMTGRDTLAVCHLMQIVSTTSSNYSGTIFLFVALAEYFHITQDTLIFKSVFPFWTAAVTLAIISAISTFGVIKELDYDYCERGHNGNLIFRIVSMIIFYLIPGIFAIIFLVSCIVHAGRGFARNKKSRHHSRDFLNSVLNITLFLLYVTACIAYLILVFNPLDSDPVFFYATVWFAIGRFGIFGFNIQNYPSHLAH